MKFKSDKHFNFVLIALAVVFSITLLFFHPQWFYRYEIKHKYTSYSSQYESTFVELAASEIKDIRIQKRFEQNDFYALYIYDLNDVIEEQTNIKADDLWLKHFSYYDLNEDGYKEIIFIYPRNDTLFLSVIDHKNKDFMCQDELLLIRGKERFAERWDLSISTAGIEKNEKNENEIFFSIWSGYAILPRGIYKYNFLTKTINKFEFGAAVHSLLFVKADILAGITSAPGNTWRLNPKPQHDDFSSWIFFFGKKLTLLNYFELNHEYNGLDLAKTYPDEEFVTLIMNRRNRKFSLINVGFDGTILKEKLLDTSKLYHTAFNKSIGNNFFLLADGELTSYNKLLEEIVLIKNPNFRDIGRMINVSIDNKKLYFYTDQEKFMLLDEDFSQIYIVKRNVDEYWYQVYPSYAKLEENRINIVENALNKRGEITLTYISNFYLIPIYFFTITAVILLLVFSLKFVIVKSAIIFSYFINSTNRLNEPILIFSNRLRLTYANRNARRKFGIQHSFWFGKKVDFVLLKNEEFVNLFNAALKRKRLPVEEIALSHKNNFMKLKCTAVPLIAPWGLVIAVYIRLEDISQQIYREREKVLSHSIQKVAHEIKTPLASILLNLESIEQNTEIKNELLIRDLNTAKNEIFRVRNFINNFLKLTNAQTPNYQSIEAENVINNALLRFTTYMERNIKIDVSGDIKEKIWCDPYQLTEALQVFIENAIDAMEGKGKITIQCEKIIIGQKAFIEFRISDEGPGIDEKIKNSLFDPYTTTKLHGTGMGLAIAKKILEDHKSKIEILSNTGSGTIVVFRIISVN